MLSDYIRSSLSRLHRKSTIRGVLTNGRDWVFLVLTLRSEGGGTYVSSPTISLRNFTGELSRDAVSLVSSIIADWVRQCYPNPEAWLMILPSGIDGAQSRSCRCRRRLLYTDMNSQCTAHVMCTLLHDPK